MRSCLRPWVGRTEDDGGSAPPLLLGQASRLVPARSHCALALSPRVSRCAAFCSHGASQLSLLRAGGSSAQKRRVGKQRDVRQDELLV